MIVIIIVIIITIIILMGTAANYIYIIKMTNRPEKITGHTKNKK